LSDDQWLLSRFLFRCAPYKLPDANMVAAIRRIREDSPPDYALPLSIATRVEWLRVHFYSEGMGDFSPDDLWRPILVAAATRDRLAIERLVTMWEGNTSKPNNRAYAAICMGLQALVRRDPVALRAAVEETRKRKSYAYVTGVNMVLEAVDSGDTPGFADGLDKMLRGIKRYLFDDAAMALIDPFAIGIYELARDYSPGIVTSFDVTRELPWDSEYHAWLSSVNDIADQYQQLEEMEPPPLIRRALFQMEGMEWAVEYYSPSWRPKK
jgi:hypothetical protein